MEPTGEDTKASVDVLIATYNPPESLLMTLVGVAPQTLRGLRVIVADQSVDPVGERQTVLKVRRVIEARGGTVDGHAPALLPGMVARYIDPFTTRGTGDESAAMRQAGSPVGAQ